MTIKQRVFLDIIEQVPYGSNKMAKQDNVVGAYIEELKQDAEAMAQAVAAAEKKFNRKYDLNDSFDRWSVVCEINSRAYAEVREARKWLVEAGYIREWTTKARFGNATYHGLTAKGWAVADRYIALAAKEATA